VFADGLDVARFLELGETVSEMADARDDEFLRAKLYQHLSIHARILVKGPWYLCRGYVGGRLDPFDGIANLLDGIDERADITGDVVEQVHSRHS
jgi:hypothetical protein